MARGYELARTLATAFLSGRWIVEELDRRGRLVLSIPPRQRWITKLARKVLSAFDVAPSRRDLIDYLNGLLAIQDDAFWNRFDYLPQPSVLLLPPPEMLPALGLSKAIEVPQLKTASELADWLGVTCGELDWFADQLRHDDSDREQLRHYRYRMLAKKSGGLRLIEIPKPRLMKLQRRILRGILSRITPHSAAHAFQSGRSIATYLATHAGQPILLHIDLRDFFPSVRAARIHALFRTVGYPESVARYLTSLCTHRTRQAAFTDDLAGPDGWLARKVYQIRHLPQGAPTSPALANLAAWRMDVRLTALAKQFDAHYTRYADDLLFSGGDQLRHGMQRFRILVLTIAISEGFSIHTRKTRVLMQSQSQRVAGIILNEHLNPPRAEFDQLKALLFNCVRFGPASQNHVGHPNFAQHLSGRIAYWSMINPQRAARLKTLFDQITWHTNTSRNE